MPALAEHVSNRSTKLLFIGDSGTGKTGALTSLVKAGFKLRVLDFDNGLDVLAQYARAQAPDKLTNVEYRTLRDKMKSSPAGPILDGSPTAFTTALQMLDHWKYDKIDLGKPSTWDAETIVVIDSLTFLSDAAFNQARFMNAGAKDPRNWFYAAQQFVESVIALLTSEQFKPNVIVIAHVTYMERDDGTKKGYPTSVGKALGPTIPAYFNNVALMGTTGSGSSIKRTIRTLPTAMIDLKNSASFKMAPELPIETGLADFFKTVRN